MVYDLLADEYAYILLENIDIIAASVSVDGNRIAIRSTNGTVHIVDTNVWWALHQEITHLCLADNVLIA